MNNRLERILAGLVAIVVIISIVVIFKWLVFIEEHPRSDMTTSKRIIIATEEYQND